MAIKKASIAVMGMLIAGAAFAQGSDLSAIAKQQRTMESKEAKEKEVLRQAAAIKERGTALTIDLFQEFYQRLKASGVKFEQIQRGTSRSQDGMVTTEVVSVSPNGEFAVANSCILGMSCVTEPRFNIKGYGLSSLDLRYGDLPPHAPGSCGDGYVTLNCKCRISAFNDTYTTQCKELLGGTGINKALREKLLTWMGTSLTAAMKERQRYN